MAPAPSAHAWLYRLNARCGRSGAGSPTIALGVYKTSAGNPSTRAAKTVSFAVATAMVNSDGSDGAVFTRDLDLAVQAFDGVPLAYGVVAITNNLNIGEQPLSASYSGNRLIYKKTGIGTAVPTDPFGYTSSIAEGWLAIWADGQDNSAPAAPSSVTIAGGTPSTNPAVPQIVGTLVPAITGNFVDPDETLPNGLAGDKLKRFQVQVINADGSLKWDSGAITATTAQQTARVGSITYAGPALTVGVTYKVRVRVADLFDAWSPWNSDGAGAYRYFSVATGAIDVTAATPTGKQETRTPGPFVAKWTHASALSTNAIQVQVLDAGTGAVLRDSGILAKTVANNANASITATEVGLVATPLTWGTNAVWRMAGRDTTNNWGSWSSSVPIPINAEPSIPSLVTPLNGEIRTAYPLLAATTSDPDDDNTTGLLVKFRIKNNAGTVLQTRTATWNAGLARWEYQVVAADFASFATYRWDAYAYDGTVYSGGTTVEASASLSTERTVVYAQGPAPTITSPADAGTITTATPTITWTVVGTQVKRRIVLTRVADSVVLHDTGDVSTAVLTYTVPASLTSGLVIHNADVIDVAVMVTDAAPLVGTDVNRVTVAYTPPPTLQPTAILETARGDITPSVVRIVWPATTYPVDQFVSYRLTRTPSAAAVAANPSLAAVPVILGNFSIAQLEYVDTRVRARIEYVYELKQLIVVGVDTIASVAGQTTVTITFNATIIEDVQNPARRVVLEARRERTITPIGDVVMLMPWNQTKPIHLWGETSYDEIDNDFTLIARTNPDAAYDLWLLRDMAKKPGPLMMKNGRGDIWFGEFASPPVITDPPGGAPQRVRFTFRELAYTENAT